MPSKRRFSLLGAFPADAGIRCQTFPYGCPRRLVDELFIDGIDRIYRRGKRCLQLKIISAGRQPERIFERKDIQQQTDAVAGVFCFILDAFQFDVVSNVCVKALSR